MIKVAIAEDQVILRECLRIMFKQDEEIEVVGCAGNGEEALELCRQLKPDIVLMDIVMPVCDGLKGLHLIKEKYPEVKVIILTFFDNDENIQKALKLGVDGYILKDIEPQDLITIIKGSMKGMKIFHRNVYSTIVRHFNHGDPKSSEEDRLSIELTEREINIIELIIQGKSNKEIADKIYLSETRIKSIISSILRKFQLEDRTQLAVYAIQNKLVK